VGGGALSGADEATSSTTDSIPSPTTPTLVIPPHPVIARKGRGCMQPPPRHCEEAPGALSGADEATSSTTDSNPSPAIPDLSHPAFPSLRGRAAASCSPDEATSSATTSAPFPTTPTLVIPSLRGISSPHRRRPCASSRPPPAALLALEGRQNTAQGDRGRRPRLLVAGAEGTLGPPIPPPAQPWKGDRKGTPSLLSPFQGSRRWGTCTQGSVAGSATGSRGRTRFLTLGFILTPFQGQEHSGRGPAGRAWTASVALVDPSQARDDKTRG